LLCCKEVNPNKPKDKLLSSQKDKKERKEKEKREKRDKNGKPLKLQLKGRIFMANVTDVVSLVKPGKNRWLRALGALLNSNRFLYSSNLVER